MTLNALKKAYQDGKLILFAGAGVSAGLGLPTWPELVNEMARQLDFDPEEFAGYGDYRALAEYYKLKKGMGALRQWMATEWHKADIDIEHSELHRIIVQGAFRRIYTTNFDHWIEAAHEVHGVPYIKISSVSDLTKTLRGVRQVIKFHGDLDDEGSIVLDETSYFERLGFESPLDIKLRADVLGKSVLFIGYSISDVNIRLLFYKLAKMWGNGHAPDARPLSYLFSYLPNPVARDVLSQWGINVLSSDQSHSHEEALIGFLRELTAE